MTDRWLVTGAAGMLGRRVVEVLRDRDIDHTACTRSDLDITDPAAVRAAVRGHRVVVNAAAWTDVDGAEADEPAAAAVNAAGPRHLAAACADTGALLLHVSTDYVFDGHRTDPYPEDAPTAPLNAYGRGKLAGEHAVTELLPTRGYVVRTGWLYDTTGRTFVTTMLRLLAERGHVDVVDDQYGQPTWAGALAVRLADLGAAALARPVPAGIYHGTAAGRATWRDLAAAVFAASGRDPDLARPVPGTRFPRPAPRPRSTVLSQQRWSAAGLPALPDWSAMVTAALTP